MKKLKKFVPRKEVLSFGFKFIVIPILILLLAVRIFVVKTYERELYFSNEAYVQRDEIKIGSEGYGNISGINVSVGQTINKSDILYKYINTDLNDKIFNLQKKGTDLLIGENGKLLENSPEANITINDFNRNVEFTVRSKIDGIIKDVNINIGDYVTRDLTAMIVEGSDAFVSSTIKVPVNQISRIVPGTAAFVKLNSGMVLSGFVKEVAPDYDPDQNLLKIKVLISAKDLEKVNLKDINSGTPVSVVVKANDDFTSAVRDFVSKINVNFLKRFLTYEI